MKIEGEAKRNIEMEKKMRLIERERDGAERDKEIGRYFDKKREVGIEIGAESEIRREKENTCESSKEGCKEGERERDRERERRIDGYV